MENNRAAKILVAEDEPDIQEMMVFMLRREGFEVVLAQDENRASQ